jgi:hypothetical protein
MNGVEIVLIILGVAAFIASFLVKDKSDNSKAVQIDSDVIRNLMEKEIDNAKERVNEVVDETVEYAVEKTERASERISNEKIMAISEYSETVLEDINKSHQEVIFLYDMLNEKHDNIKETVKQVDKTAKEITKEMNEIAKEPEKEKETEKFDAYSFVEQAPHIVKKEQNVPPLTLQSVPLQTIQPVKFVQPVQILQTENASHTATHDVAVAPILVSAVATPNVENAEPVMVEPHVVKPQVVEPQEAEQKVVEPHVVEPIHVIEPYVIEQPQEPQFETALDEEDEQPENNNDRILEMHKAGMGNVEIAKELGLGVGEVKLVINLFKGAI